MTAPMVLSLGANIGRLMALGLNSYEAKVYFSLLGRHSSTASEVSRTSGVPRQKVYDTLEGLVRKGLCVIRPGRVKKYTATDPRRALGRLVNGFVQEQRQREEMVSLLIKELDGFYRLGRDKTSPLEYVEVLRELNQIIERFLELQMEVKKEMVAFVKTPFALPFGNNTDELKALWRGVKIRAIYEEKDILKEPSLRAAVEECIEAGEEVRLVEELPMKFAVFDRTKVIFALDDPLATRQSLTAVVIEHPSLASVLQNLFETTWQKARRYNGIEE